MPEISIYGLRDTMRALKSMDEAMFKEMDAKFKAIFEPLAVAARGNVPPNVMSGWGHRNGGEWGSRLRFDPQAVKRGIKIKSSNKGPKYGRAVSAQYLLVNSNAAGSVFETAGANRSNAPRNPPRGTTRGSAQFITNAMRFGPPNRVIWRAWDRLRGDEKAKQAVRDAVREAERQVQELVDRAQGRGEAA